MEISKLTSPFSAKAHRHIFIFSRARLIRLVMNCSAQPVTFPCRASGTATAKPISRFTVAARVSKFAKVQTRRFRRRPTALILAEKITWETRSDNPVVGGFSTATANGAQRFFVHQTRYRYVYAVQEQSTCALYLVKSRSS